MRGTVIIFDKETRKGKISGQDGKRYDFSLSDLRGATAEPYNGMEVDFEAHGSEAKDIVVIQQSASATNKSRAIYILLAFFLGTLGIHNFYAGRTLWGVVQLLIGLTSPFLLFISLIPLYVWILVEMIVITEDSEGRKMI